MQSSIRDHSRVKCVDCKKINFGNIMDAKWCDCCLKVTKLYGFYSPLLPKQSGTQLVYMNLDLTVTQLSQAFPVPSERPQKLNRNDQSIGQSYYLRTYINIVRPW